MTENLDNQVSEVVSIGAPSLKSAIEAILLVVDTPVTSLTIAQVTNTPEVEVIKSLKKLQKEFDEREGGITLREVAGGWRDRKSTRLNSSHMSESRMPSSA